MSLRLIFSPDSCSRFLKTVMLLSYDICMCVAKLSHCKLAIISQKQVCQTCTNSYNCCVTVLLCIVLRLNVPVNNFSVMSGRSLGLSSTVGSSILYHYATALQSCDGFANILANKFGKCLKLKISFANGW